MSVYGTYADLAAQKYADAVDEALEVQALADAVVPVMADADGDEWD